MTKLTTSNSDRIEMGIPLISDLVVAPPEEEEVREGLEVMSATVQFWAFCGVGMGILSQLAGIGMAFLFVNEFTSNTMCWVYFGVINAVFGLLEYFLFVFVSDIARLQVIHAPQNGDTDSLVQKWRLAFLFGLVVGAICVGVLVIYKR